ACRAHASPVVRPINQLLSLVGESMHCIGAPRAIVAPDWCDQHRGRRVVKSLNGHRSAPARFWCTSSVAAAGTVYSRALWGLNAHDMKLGHAPRTFQELIFTLQHYWSQQGCVILEPYDMEVGAGTFHTATFLRAVGPEPWRAAYVQASRRPTDGRY